MQTQIKCSLTVLVAAVSLAAASQIGSRVTLNVIAFDSHDQIVGDLNSQDFQVTDQGKPQRIVSFHRNTDPQTTRNNVTNAPQAVPPVVILFDLQNDNLSNRGQGTEEIIHALEHLESSDSLYLYLLTSQGQLSPVHGLLSPGERNPPTMTPWTRRIKPLLDTAIENAYGLRTANDLGTFAAIEALGTAIKPFPGRKHLIWMTHGVPLSYGNALRGGDNSLLINQIATTLDHDNVTLSTVYQGINVGNGDIDTLDQFAQLTGGTVYHNDIDKAVKEATAASGSGYTIEYNAPPLDGKYHKVRVTCPRKGVRLQVKQGYYAH